MLTIGLNFAVVARSFNVCDVAPFFLAGHSDWIAQRGSCCGEYLLFQCMVSAKEHGLPVLIGWPRPSRVRFE